MKSPQEKFAVFILAALFSAARVVAKSAVTPKQNFDDAEAFVEEAKTRGINVEDLK